MSDVVQLRKIKKVKFGLLSSEDIYNITSNITITQQDNTSEIKSHLDDLYNNRFGAINGLCKTCKLNKIKCPGHFGYIDFEQTPLYNPFFIDIIAFILTYTCEKCCSIMQPIEHKKYLMTLPLNTRGSYIKKVTKKIFKCELCLNVYKRIFKNLNYIDIIEINENKKETIIDSKHIYEIFSRLTNDDISLFGINPKTSHPKNMIIKKLLVAPPTIRPNPYNNNDISQKYSEDNLTKIYNKILLFRAKVYSELKKFSTMTTDQKNNFNNDLTFMKIYVSYLMTDKTQSNQFIIKTTASKTVNSIKKILEKKNGFLRNKINGRRINYCGRTVISGGSIIDVDEIGVPLRLCIKIPTRLVVSDYTRKKYDFYKLIMNGPNVWPGSYIIIKSNGKKKHFIWKESLLQSNDILKRKGLYKYYKIAKNIYNNLENGDKIDRHLYDGDYVLLNRQPTLHKSGVMAHRVKIIGGKDYTFRLNTFATPPYNADFDGDEMNMCIVQHTSAIVECQNILAVKKHILETIGSKVTIKPIHDNVIAGYLITKYSNDTIDRCHFMNIIINATYYKKDYILNKISNIKKIRYIELFNVILPKEFTYYSSKFQIKDGIWIKGLLTAKLIGDIIKNIIMQHNADRALKFQSAYQKMTDAFLMFFGITLSVEDLVIPKTIKNKCIINIKKCQIENDNLLRKFHEGNVVAPMTQNITDYFEFEVLNIINKYTKINNDLLEEYLNSSNNNFVYQYKSGARGKIDNMHQIFNSVGQQILWGKRIQNEYGNDRALPHFTKFDNSLTNRGFIFRSFCDGITPIEYHHHSKMGRIGMTDTATKTADTGYANRILVKLNENVIFSYDMIIRNQNEIISFSYGHNNYDTTLQFGFKLNLFNLTNDEFKKKYI